MFDFKYLPYSTVSNLDQKACLVFVAKQAVKYYHSRRSYLTSRGGGINQASLCAEYSLLISVSALLHFGLRSESMSVSCCITGDCLQVCVINNIMWEK
jgi:hypothetical protein